MSQVVNATGMNQDQIIEGVDALVDDGKIKIARAGDSMTYKIVESQVVGIDMPGIPHTKPQSSFAAPASPSSFYPTGRPTNLLPHFNQSPSRISTAAPSSPQSNTPSAQPAPIYDQFIGNLGWNSTAEVLTENARDFLKQIHYDNSASAEIIPVIYSKTGQGSGAIIVVKNYSEMDFLKTRASLKRIIFEKSGAWKPVYVVTRRSEAQKIEMRCFKKAIDALNCSVVDDKYYYTVGCSIWRDNNIVVRKDNHGQPIFTPLERVLVQDHKKKN